MKHFTPLGVLLFWLVVVFLLILPARVGLTQDASSEIFGLNWNPDGTRIATGYRDGVIKIWDAANAALLTTFQLPDPFNPDYFLEIIYQVEWSPDGNRIAIGEMSEFPIGFLHVMDAATGTIISTTQVQDGPPEISWSPDGTRIAATAFSISLLDHPYALLIIDADIGEVLFRIDLPELQGIGSVDWSPDGSRIATGGSLNNSVQIWDANSGTLLMTLQGHTEDVGAVRWNSDGTRIATFASDDTFRIWDASNGQNIQTIRFPYPQPYPIDIAWQPNSSNLALMFRTSIEVVDAATWQTVNTLPGGGVAAWSSDGTRLAINHGSFFCIVDVTDVSEIPIPRSTVTPATPPTPIGLCSS